jgi:hypothetical protein
MSGLEDHAELTAQAFHLPMESSTLPHLLVLALIHTSGMLARFLAPSIALRLVLPSLSHQLQAPSVYVYHLSFGAAVQLHAC